MIRLQNGDLWVWSPIGLKNTLQSADQYLGLPIIWSAQTGCITFFLAIGMPRIRTQSSGGLHQQYESVLTSRFSHHSSTIHRPLGPIKLISAGVRGSFMMDEIVFFHQKSRTVILSDLSQNFSSKWLAGNWTAWQRTVARASKIVEGNGLLPLDWRLTFVDRRKLRGAK